MILTTLGTGVVLYVVSTLFSFKAMVILGLALIMGMLSHGR